MLESILTRIICVAADAATINWLTLALVITTIVYARATSKILKANQDVVAVMKEQVEAQMRPYVVISVAPRVGSVLLMLEIQNTGKSPAQNLNLRIDKDFYFNASKNENDNISKLPVFTRPIESLAPGAHLAFQLGVGHTIFSDGVDETICPKVFNISASYEHAAKTYSENNNIDIYPLLRSTSSYEPVSDEIKNLRNSLESLLKK